MCQQMGLESPTTRSNWFGNDLSLPIFLFCIGEKNEN